jgi:hypothetical protein
MLKVCWEIDVIKNCDWESLIRDSLVRKPLTWDPGFVN